jgi:prevent-host-death family protein
MTVVADLEVSAADANRNFSDLLRQVREGRTIVVTVHGKATAKLIPFDAAQQRAGTGRAVLMARLAGQRSVKAGRWTRESLYQR